MATKPKIPPATAAKTLDELGDNGEVIPRAQSGKKPEDQTQPTKSKKVVEPVKQPKKGRQVATKQVRNRPVYDKPKVPSRFDREPVPGGIDWDADFHTVFGSGGKYLVQGGKKFSAGGHPLKG